MWVRSGALCGVGRLAGVTGPEGAAGGSGGIGDGGGEGEAGGSFKKIADNPELNAFPRGQDTASRERGAGRDAVHVACCSAVY